MKLTEERKKQLQQELDMLEAKIEIVTTMQKKLDLKDKILNIKMELNETKLPDNFAMECVGCGS